MAENRCRCGEYAPPEARYVCPKCQLENATDPDSERLPLTISAAEAAEIIKGGQGRSGQSTAEHAAIVCLCLAACVACVIAVFCWGRFERSKEPRKAEIIILRD